MKLGDLVTDYALEMSGIIVGSMWTEERGDRDSIHWKWLVLYQDGALQGADANALQVANETR